MKVASKEFINEAKNVNDFHRMKSRGIGSKDIKLLTFGECIAANTTTQTFLEMRIKLTKYGTFIFKYIFSFIFKRIFFPVVTIFVGYNKKKISCRQRSDMKLMLMVKNMSLCMKLQLRFFKLLPIHLKVLTIQTQALNYFLAIWTEGPPSSSRKEDGALL